MVGKKEFLKFDELKTKQLEVKTKFPEILEGDIATYVYTSGTTAESKGVVLIHKNILSNIYTAIK